MVPPSCNDDGEIVTLILDSNSLHGTLPGIELSWLTKLEILSLHDNLITSVSDDSVSDDSSSSNNNYGNHHDENNNNNNESLKYLALLPNLRVLDLIWEIIC